tara:strand:+ start:1685 stop:3310 length:1626 start_codon:yes stop_codon:yes gene_type:complete
MASDDLARLLNERFGSLAAQRVTWESHWQEIADYVVPRKADITKTRSPGDKRSELIFDGTAIHAAELMSASLHGMLTNPSTKWFSLRFGDIILDGNDEAREWLESVEDVMYQEFASSNFQEQIHELYHDLITFGTGIMFVEGDEEQTPSSLRFSTRHIGECYVSENEYGRVDTVFRKFKIPIRAAISRFGADTISEKLVKQGERDPYSLIDLVHAVYPRDSFDVTRVDAVNKPFASVYYDADQKTVLSESGFDEFPYLAPRYLKASYEIGYGRSPAMTALADIKMLNKMSEVTIRAAQKQVDPPLLVPDDGFILPIRTVPGGLNFYRSGTRDRIEPLNIGANNPLGLNMEEQRRKAIQSAFYVDQLILGQGPQMTATEVVQRTEEKMRLLGPVLGRLQAELLQPLITRVYNILERKQFFRVAPEFIQNNDISIEYVSPLAKAQRMGDVQSAMRLFELLGPVAQIDRGIMDYVDSDGLTKHMIRALSVPASAVRGDEEVVAIRQQRQARQEEQRQLAQAQQVAEAAGSAAPALKAAQGLGVV